MIFQLLIARARKPRIAMSELHAIIFDNKKHVKLSKLRARLDMEHYDNLVKRARKGVSCANNL